MAWIVDGDLAPQSSAGSWALMVGSSIASRVARMEYWMSLCFKSHSKDDGTASSNTGIKQTTIAMPEIQPCSAMIKVPQTVDGECQ
ncbi:hypothetical protein KC361_g125 [Hortaea werneckii]|nr:hypothetical protein KC361_g125 [Hortaea werneckii]